MSMISNEWQVFIKRKIHSLFEESNVTIRYDLNIRKKVFKRYGLKKKDKQFLISDGIKEWNFLNDQCNGKTKHTDCTAK